MFSEIVSAHVYYPFKLAGTKFCSAGAALLGSYHNHYLNSWKSPGHPALPRLKTFYFSKKLIFNLYFTILHSSTSNCLFTVQNTKIWLAQSSFEVLEMLFLGCSILASSSWTSLAWSAKKYKCALEPRGPQFHLQPELWILPGKESWATDNISSGSLPAKTVQNYLKCLESATIWTSLSVYCVIGPGCPWLFCLLVC